MLAAGIFCVPISTVFFLLAFPVPILWKCCLFRATAVDRESASQAKFAAVGVESHYFYTCTAATAV